MGDHKQTQDFTDKSKKVELEFKKTAHSIAGIYEEAATFFRDNEFDGAEELDKSRNAILAMVNGEITAHFPVFGTVKAGKSTFLNFVFQEELLPARPLPMTTLPIRIMHKNEAKGQSLEIPEPLFNALNAAVSKLQGRVDLESEEGKKLNKTTAGLPARINEGVVRFERKYSEREGMLQALFDISDICRLIFSLEEKMEDYDIEVVLEKLPLITLHMKLFSDLPEQNVYFIDTPGPDEASAMEVLAKVNTAVLEASSGTLFISPHDRICNTANQRLLSDLAAYQLHKRLLVVLNKIDSIKGGKLAEELKKLYDVLDETLSFVKDKVILPTSGFYLERIMKIDSWLSSEGSASEAISDAPFYEDLKQDVDSSWLCETREELQAKVDEAKKTYNSQRVLDEMRSLYSNAIKYAISAKVGDVYSIALGLEEKLSWTQQYLDGDEYAKKKIDEGLEAGRGILTQIDELLGSISGDVATAVRSYFATHFTEPMEEYMKEQKWIIVNSFGKPIPDSTWHNLASYKLWVKAEPEMKVTNHQNLKFKELSERATPAVNHILAEKWMQLKLDIHELEKIELFHDQNILDASTPPEIVLPSQLSLLDLPNAGMFDGSVIPYQTLPCGKVRIQQSALGPAVEKEVRAMFDPISEAMIEMVDAQLKRAVEHFAARLEQLKSQVSQQLEENKKLGEKKAEAIEEMKQFNQGLTERFSFAKKRLMKLGEALGTPLSKKPKPGEGDTASRQEKDDEKRDEGEPQDDAQGEGTDDVDSKSQSGSDSEEHGGDASEVPPGALAHESIVPGMKVSLFAAHEKMAVCMSGEDPFLLVGLDEKDSHAEESSSEAMKQFEIVDAGEGMVALYNSHQRSFISMDGEDAHHQVRGGGEEDKEGEIDEDKRWAVVDAGEGQIAFWNASQRRFMRMVSSVIDGMGDEREVEALPSPSERFWVLPSQK